MTQEELNNKIDFVTTNIGDKVLEPRPNSALSMASGILIDPASKEFHNTTDLVSNTLIKELNFYKNVVINEINTLTEIAETDIREKINDLEVKVPSIGQIKIPEFIKLLLDRQTIRKVDNSDLSTVTLTIPTPDNIDEYINYNKGELGEYVNSFIIEQDAGFFKYVWGRYLNDLSLSNINVFRIINSNNTFDSDLDNDLYGLYILVRGLMDNPPRTVSGDLSTYENALINYEKTLSNTIYKKTERYSKLVTNETVIAGSTDNKIFVIDSNYIKLLEKDISIEVILGAGLVLGKQYSSSALVNGKDRFEKEWNKSYSAQKVKNNNSLNLLYRSILAGSIKKYCNDYLPSKSNIFKETKEELLEKVSVGIDEIDEVNKANIKDVIRKFVINVIFEDTNASSFFNYVDKYTGKSYNLDLEHAISYAMLEMIIDFYASDVIAF